MHQTANPAEFPGKAGTDVPAGSTVAPPGRPQWVFGNGRVHNAYGCAAKMVPGPVGTISEGAVGVRSATYGHHGWVYCLGMETDGWAVTEQDAPEDATDITTNRGFYGYNDVSTDSTNASIQRILAILRVIGIPESSTDTTTYKVHPTIAVDPCSNRLSCRSTHSGLSLAITSSPAFVDALHHGQLQQGAPNRGGRHAAWTGSWKIPSCDRTSRDFHAHVSPRPHSPTAETAPAPQRPVQAPRLMSECALRFKHRIVHRFGLPLVSISITTFEPTPHLFFTSSPTTSPRCNLHQGNLSRTRLCTHNVPIAAHQPALLFTSVPHQASPADKPVNERNNIQRH
ncbi:uncharacterized protein CANTADRAFT_269100 [Suhomyces tanzawaensis NRRL Y-17324]|uniref:Uncharacterized protein n=1 Tax=Suhomyces tanzawaensis NRRL Y-17324 TaxID=984487 RepID=A0A1E4SGD7_9ASCO|nr:uncharacterized protein CANTADRAFT_269100 [Suhomyces tanzawaensis NRRL Y-17324]ODV78568.1 hypothetical protein CANTADRAFT_269100 [Suhomyces tanzawaensis NRRL Y-17324]